METRPYSFQPRPYRCRFDFEVGHLLRSPCRDCEDRSRLPVCMPSCRVLDDIQSVLAETVSCTRRR